MGLAVREPTGHFVLPMYKQRFEYLVLSLAHEREPWDPDRVMERLDEAGKDGWELVAVTHPVYYFKRPLYAEWPPQRAKEEEAVPPAKSFHPTDAELAS